MSDTANHRIPEFEDKFQLADEQRRVAEIGGIVNSSLHIADVYPRVAEHTRALVRADWMVIAIIGSPCLP